jgi:hypothetical protein
MTRAIAHEVHDRPVHVDPLDDEAAAHEREEPETHVEAVGAEERLGVAEGGIVRDLDAGEHDADPAAEREAEAARADVAAEPAAETGEQAVRSSRRDDAEGDGAGDAEGGHAPDDERGPPRARHPPSSW